MKDVEGVMIKLGKLAMKGLQREHFQQSFTKVIENNMLVFRFDI